MNMLRVVRKWIDGENPDEVAEKINMAARTRSVSEDFLVAIGRELGAVMERELFTPPGGLPLIPRQYVVFLSAGDDREWQGGKRHGLESGLAHALRQKVIALTGADAAASPARCFIELRVDGTLVKGQFRVQAVWDSDADRTEVGARRQQIVADSGEEESDEMTVLHPRPKAVLYTIEVERAGGRQFIFPVTKTEITVGRGSKSFSVDLPLTGNPEVSRFHLLVGRDKDGCQWLIRKGRNPVLVNDREIAREQKLRLASDDEVTVCDFKLRIR